MRNRPYFLKMIFKASLLTLAMVFFILQNPAFAQKKTKSPTKKSPVTYKSEEGAAKSDVYMTVGMQTTVDLDFKICEPRAECIKVTNIGLFVQAPQYSEQKNQLIFSPQKRGETTITIRNEAGDISLILHAIISESNLSRRVIELRKLLQDIEGIDFEIMGDKIVIDGEVVVINDLNRLYAVLSDPSYKDMVLNLVTVSPVGMQILAERMQAEINNQNVKVRVLGNQFVVEGQVDSAAQAESILTTARAMLQGFTIPTFELEGKKPIEIKRNTPKDPILSKLVVKGSPPPPPPKMIRLTLDFVELSKDYLRNFGFSWAPSLDTGGSVSFGQSTTGGVTTEGSGSLSGTIANLFPKLNSAQNAGYARILEENVILVKAGTQGEFARVLDVPVQTVTPQGLPNFTKVQVGPQLKIKPTIVGQGQEVDLSIAFKYGGLAGKQGTAPIILNHEYKGAVVVRSGESAAVVNAITNSVSTAFNKDPPGNGIPTNPLYVLLRSKAFQKNKSQFVIFITPQIIESSSVGTEDIKQKYGMKRKVSSNK